MIPSVFNSPSKCFVLLHLWSPLTIYISRDMSNLLTNAIPWVQALPSLNRPLANRRCYQAFTTFNFNMFPFHPKSSQSTINLEKQCLGYISAKYRLVPPTHYGGVPGRSAQDTLTMMNDIETAWHHNKVVTMLTYDIITVVWHYPPLKPDPNQAHTPCSPSYNQNDLLIPPKQEGYYIHGKQASHSMCHKIFTLHCTSSLTHIFGPSFSLMVVSFHLIKKSCSLKFAHQTTIDHYWQYDSVDCHHGMLPLNPLI